jgi:serine/threonine protein kinase
MKDIHKNFIIHRDLKLKNIFVDKDLNLRIGDLGIVSQSIDFNVTARIGTFGY